MAYWRRYRWLVGMIACVALAPVASAQQGLPTSLITNINQLSPAELDLIRQHVARYVPGLDSDDPMVVRRARQALQSPVTLADATLAPSPRFRFAYASELATHLERIVASGDTPKSIIALHLAGAIATSRTAQIPLANLDNQSSSIRYASARALGLTFQALDRSAPAVRDVPHLIASLRDRLAIENEAFVLDRITQTLAVAADFHNPAVRENRILALDAISSAVGERLQKLEPSKNNVHRLQMLLRALETVQASFLQGVFTEPPTPSRDASVVAAAGLGGDAMNYVAKRVELGIDKPQERNLLVKMAISGETIIYFAQSAHTAHARGVRPQAPGTANKLKSSQDQEYLRELRKIYTGPGAILTSPPFSLDPARFAR